MTQAPLGQMGKGQEGMEMRRGLQGWVLVLVWMLAGVWARAAVSVATTTIADTVYHADGTTATGLVIVSWQAFTTAGGSAVPSGSVSATIAAGGGLQVSLAPNVGATPVGTYYTAVYHLDDGSVSREYWMVPSSAVPVTISSIRASVLPAAVALQTVTKSYVDTTVAAALAGVTPGGTIPFVAKTGDTMTGPLTLAGDPSAATQAATKRYVDASAAAVASGIASQVSTTPATTQVVTQPVGTQLQTNHLNGSLYVSQYASGQGNNGIANAAGTTDCAAGCDLKVDTTYNSPESYDISKWKSSAVSGTHYEDLRGGGKKDIFFNPRNQLTLGDDVGQIFTVFSSRSAASVAQVTGSEGPSSGVLQVDHVGLTGGSNLFPASIESNPPYFKSNYVAESVNGSYNTMGQHVLSSHFINCYGVGDCLAGSQFLTASGGFRDEADEGAHPFDLQIQEDTKVFQGTCATGCTVGSTQVMVNVTANAGTQGEGRYLLDLNTADAITTGTLTGGAMVVPGNAGPTAIFAGTNFPVSVFLQTTNTALSQPHTMAPGTVTLGVLASGVPSGFATSTAALPAASGVACLADQPNSYNPTNYEMAPYTVVDATHIRMTLNKVHASGATIAAGGLCGYGLEQKVDTQAGIRQVFPVIGSISPTSLYYAGHLTSLVGQMFQSSGYLNMSASIASVVRASGLTTVTTATNFQADLTGLTLTVAGVSDASFDGNFVVTATGSNTLTYANTGSDGSSSGGTIGVVTGAFALYPMAEVLGVLDAANNSLDGTMTLAPNTVPWAANDPVEEPHYFQEQVSPDQEYIGQIVPRPTETGRAGLVYERELGPGMRGWTIQNAVPPQNYLGNGGTHWAPDIAYEALGVWQRTFEAQAGDVAAFYLHCNSHGCGRWNSGYDLFEMDSNTGVDVFHYEPQTNNYSMRLGGATFGFGPAGLTAGTVGATTLNVATVNAGGVRTAGSSVFSGGGTVFGSGTPLLSGPGSEAYVQAVSSPGNNAGVFISRANAENYASLDLVTGPTGNTGWSLQMQPNSSDAVLLDRVTGTAAMTCHSGAGCQFAGGVTAANFTGVLSGRTGTIGGAALAAGVCASGTVSVVGAVVGTPVVVSASDGSLPSGTTLLSGAVTTAGQVTVQVCAVAAGTPAAKTYNVRVIE